MVEKHEALEQARIKIRKRRRIIWLSIAGVLVLLILFYTLYSFTNVFFGSSKNIASSPQAGEWTMFRHDLLHTGNSDAGTAVPSGNIKWTFTAGAGIHSSPAVVDGTVYVGSRDYHLYALDAATGELKWSFLGGSWFDSSPVVSGGVVYCGCNDGYLYAIDAKTGNKIWQFSAKYGWRSSPAIADGIIYIGNDDSNLYAVDARTGKGIWRHSTGDMITSSPAVSNGVVIVGSSDGLVYSFNAKNGQERLQFQTSVVVTSSPAVKNGVAYVTDSYGYMYALDMSARNWLWENKIRYYWNVLYVYGVAPKPPNTSGYVWSSWLGFGINSASSAAIVDNNAYLGAGENVVSVNLTTHKVGWTFKTGDLVLSSPAVAGNAIFVGSDDGHIYALDRSTGAKLWDIATGNQVSSSPAVANGVVYIGSEDGKLYAID